MSSYKNRIKQIVSDVDKKIREQFGGNIYSNYRNLGTFNEGMYLGLNMVSQNHAKYVFSKKKNLFFDELNIVFVPEGKEIDRNIYDEKTLFVLLINDLTDLEFIDWKDPIFDSEGKIESFEPADDDFCIGYLNGKDNTASDFINKIPNIGHRINNIIYVENENCFVSLISGYKKIKKQYVKADVFAHYEPEINFSLHSLHDDEGFFDMMGFKIFFNDLRFHQSSNMIDYDSIDYLVDHLSVQSNSLCYSMQKLHLNIEPKMLPRPDFPNIKKEIRTANKTIEFQDINPSHLKCSKRMSHFDFGDNWRALMTEKRCRTQENSFPLGATRVRIFSVIKAKYKGKGLYIVKMQSLDSSWDGTTDETRPVAESHLFWNTRNASWKLEDLLEATCSSDMEDCLNKTMVIIKHENPDFTSSNLGMSKKRNADQYVYTYCQISDLAKDFEDKIKDSIEEINLLPLKKDILKQVLSEKVIFIK